MSYRLRPRAERDVYEIMSYIGKHNPRAALRWQDEIYATFQLLCSMPGIGAARETSRLKSRMFSKDGYLIFCRPDDEGIEILRVLHAARDWPKLLR
ncbi:type II toxin-antitoxin system RelE/ParE family toxin [Rhizobium oryzicola]|uniref:Type II toxin-antitoxin system RelE/ParE family toxin n=1 Tax=Rhizobium oryzicola TaxID=1232668 RepID=A0ABT8SZB1_9HYPH|nr:type II toxin-antitoxin system RelE/ParE family toxin [Rhizobium oryzicola]MDO1583780.1 type II toxin-antitoxin system RelE/ParE family toxin [Rhizobium oryzicola]